MNTYMNNICNNWIHKLVTITVVIFIDALLYNKHYSFLLINYQIYNDTQ